MNRRTLLVQNEAPRSFSVLTCNLLPKGCRIDQLEGRDYTVVPMVILTEGVHAGSLGPLLYSEEELSKTPAAWNHKPIVVYHPSINGVGVSACDPVILNNRKVGVMMNTKFEGGRLKSEAWIEKDRADIVDKRIMAAIEAKEMMELSTGVFIDIEPNEGKWKKEDYTGIARNFRPDHLALLPDQIGACSIKDGAGLLRNAKGEKPVTENLTGNQMSFDNISCSLRSALSAKFNLGNAMDGPMVWLASVYPDFVIYENDGKLWRLGYTTTDTDVTLGNETPVEVVRVTEYRTVAGAYVGNRQPTNHQNQNIMKKQSIVAILMANAIGAIAGVTLTANMTDEQLKSVTEEQLEQALNGILKPKPVENKAPVANAAAPKPKAGESKGDYMARGKEAGADPAACTAMYDKMSQNSEEPKVVSLEDYINGAPKEVQEVLNNSMAVYNDEKKKLVAVILANKNNGFTQQDLDSRPLGELKNLARLAAVEEKPTSRTANYSGMAPAANAEEEVLQIPALNFDRSKN